MQISKPLNSNLTGAPNHNSAFTSYLTLDAILFFAYFSKENQNMFALPNFRIKLSRFQIFQYNALYLQYKRKLSLKKLYECYTMEIVNFKTR